MLRCPYVPGLTNAVEYNFYPRQSPFYLIHTLQNCDVLEKLFDSDHTLPKNNDGKK